MTEYKVLESLCGTYPIQESDQMFKPVADVYKIGYDQGRKDAIDEVLALIKSVEANLICEAEWAEWLESRLKCSD